MSVIATVLTKYEFRVERRILNDDTAQTFFRIVKDDEEGDWAHHSKPCTLDIGCGGMYMYIPQTCNILGIGPSPFNRQRLLYVSIV